GASTTDNTTEFTPPGGTASETLDQAAHTTTGSFDNLLGSGSRQVWSYFTNSPTTAPDANNPPSNVLSMQVGQTLTATMSFVIPTNLYMTTPNGTTANTLVNPPTKKTDFRFGLFYEPGDPTTTPITTFPRVLTDTNNNAGTNGSVTTPWAHSQGYAFSIPI